MQSLPPRRRWLVITCALALAFSAPTWSLTQPAFTDLAPGSEAYITLRSSGCFHDTTHRLVMRRSDGVSVSRSVVPGTQQPVQPTWITLSNEDLRNLDRLMAFYRREPPDRCTTTESITVTWMHPVLPTYIEDLRDGSCDLDYRYFTFQTLLTRLEAVSPIPAELGTLPAPEADDPIPGPPPLHEF